MRTNGSKQLWASLGVGLLALAVACGDDKGEDAEVGNETGGTEVGDGDGGDGDGDAGDGDGDAGDGDGDAGDGDGDAGDGDGDAGDGDGDAGDGDGEPNPECFDLDSQAACDDHPDCQSVIGSPLKKNGPDSPCLQPAEFLGCIPAQGCGDAITWFCANNSTWQVPDTCGPENAEQCEGPNEPVDACP
jgi:hypothetical protein